MNAKTSGLVGLSLISLLIVGCSKEPEATVIKPTPVRVGESTSGPSTPAISTNGIVATKDEMRLSFKMGGVIKAIHVAQGQSVSQGEKLAEIELTEVNAEVEQVQQLELKAKRDLERGERLYADQVISLEQLQDLRTQYAMSAARLKSARFNRGYSVITAPRDGVVLRKFAEERELTAAGAPVLLLGARDRGYVVKAALSDREIVQLKLGDPAEIRMDAFPGRTIAGSLVEIASAADEKTGMFPIEVRFEETPVALSSGLVAKLNVFPVSAKASLLTYVPIGAVVEGDRDRASVFVVKGDRVERREVRVAFVAADSVALAQGLDPGQPVVTDGSLYLEENEQIEVVRDDPAADGAQVADSASKTG